MERFFPVWLMLLCCVCCEARTEGAYYALAYSADRKNAVILKLNIFPRNSTLYKANKADIIIVEGRYDTKTSTRHQKLQNDGFHFCIDNIDRTNFLAEAYAANPYGCYCHSKEERRQAEMRLYSLLTDEEIPSTKPFALKNGDEKKQISLKVNVPYGVVLEFDFISDKTPSVNDANEKFCITQITVDKKLFDVAVMAKILNGKYTCPTSDLRKADEFYNILFPVTHRLEDAFVMAPVGDGNAKMEPKAILYYNGDLDVALDFSTVTKVFDIQADKNIREKSLKGSRKFCVRRAVMKSSLRLPMASDRDIIELAILAQDGHCPNDNLDVRATALYKLLTEGQKAADECIQRISKGVTPIPSTNFKAVREASVMASLGDGDAIMEAKAFLYYNGDLNVALDFSTVTKVFDIQADKNIREKSLKGSRKFCVRRAVKKSSLRLPMASDRDIIELAILAQDGHCPNRNLKIWATALYVSVIKSPSASNEYLRNIFGISYIKDASLISNWNVKGIIYYSGLMDKVLGFKNVDNVVNFDASNNLTSHFEANTDYSFCVRTVVTKSKSIQLADASDRDSMELALLARNHYCPNDHLDDWATALYKLLTEGPTAADDYLADYLTQSFVTLNSQKNRCGQTNQIAFNSPPLSMAH